MPQMPEIMGQDQDLGPPGVAGGTRTPRGRGPEFDDRPSKDHPWLRHSQSGVSVSPLTMRLVDFSGEGERAPP